MPRTYFRFSGGKQLTRISASWFVSYMYYMKKDTTHSNWKNVSDPMNRALRCDNNSAHHKVWISEIVNMNPNRLNKNQLGLSGNDIISMAKVLLSII